MLNNENIFEYGQEKHTDDGKLVTKKSQKYNDNIYTG